MKPNNLAILKGFLKLFGALLVVCGGILLSSWATQRLSQPAKKIPQKSSPDLKRSFEVLVSASALALLLPFFAVIAFIIRLTSPGPVFYLATRIGRDGQPFKLYKFRSMVVGADKRGPGVTTTGDARVTPIGRVLRRYKIDELPQLINVLKGDMSLVGPRPEDPRYVALYTPEQRRILTVRPGITSRASVHYRDEENLLSGPDWEQHYIQRIMPTKIALDMDYVDQASLITDMKLIWATLQAILPSTSKHNSTPDRVTTLS
jgi:lipopolysaccharide/colanic/teichoic acid biosynthesis glycosyltransferase